MTGRIRKALARLIPHLPVEALEDVLCKVRQTEPPSLIEENRRRHHYLIEGMPVEVARDDGSVGSNAARLIDFTDADSNDWLAVNQFTVVERQNNRRPDVVLFVNGLPLAVIELKNSGDENVILEGTFNQIQTYKDDHPLTRGDLVSVGSDHSAPGFVPWLGDDPNLPKVPGGDRTLEIFRFPEAPNERSVATEA